jgi:hypothetical protein
LPFLTRVTGNGADPSIALDSAATRRPMLLASETSRKEATHDGEEHPVEEGT